MPVEGLLNLIPKEDCTCSIKLHVSRVNLNTGDLEVVAESVPGLDNLAFDSEDHFLLLMHRTAVLSKFWMMELVEKL